ncbi:MutS protein msh4 [Serendipita sp. 398]|nr:MutS protein msh4 [Serendipita sp. 398]
MKVMFTPNKGEEFVAQLSLQDQERAALLVSVHDRYYALQAVCAVFKFIEISFSTIYAHHTLSIKYHAVEGSMMIDTDTARNLELVDSISRQKAHSLFGLLNSTLTPQGSRLLRTSLLSPLTSQSAIEARLDAVANLVQSDEHYNSIHNAIKGVQKIDMDKLIVRLAAIDKSGEISSGVGLESIAVKTAYERLGQLLDLQKVIKNLPVVAHAASETQARLLRIIGELVLDPRITEIRQVIERHLNDTSIGPKRGSVGALSTVTARVYAVKAEANPLLDVARASYKENVHDIFDLGKAVAEKYELPIELVYQQENGGSFVFCLSRTPIDASGWQWPKEWVDKVQKKKKWVFSTLELKKLNGRMREMLYETLTISATIVHEVFTQVVSRISALYKASEAIALLDVLLCFAKRALDGGYVRPEFTGTLAIKSGRHPMLETIQAAGRTVANDVYASDSSRFQIIQGPFLKPSFLACRIGLLSVMASCGSFVPAGYASFKLGLQTLGASFNNRRRFTDSMMLC